MTEQAVYKLTGRPASSPTDPTIGENKNGICALERDQASPAPYILNEFIETEYDMEHFLWITKLFSWLFNKFGIRTAPSTPRLNQRNKRNPD